MRKQILSFLMAVMMIFTIIPSLGLEIAAANAPAKLTNPSITPIEQSANKYVGYYDDEVSNSSKLTVKWRDVGQEYFNVAVKLLNGEPLTSSNEDGKYFYSLIREYQSNSITISASQMKEAAGKWVKVYIQSHFADGTENECHYYFKVSGAKFSRKPTLSLSVSGNELDTGVYGMYNPGETVYFNCTANYSDHIFVQTSSDDLYFTNPEGYVGKSGTFIEESSASASTNRSYENGEKMQIYINIAEDAEPGDYTITVTATDGVYDPDTFSSIPGTSYYSSEKKSVTVRVAAETNSDTDEENTQDELGFPYPSLLDFSVLEDSFYKIAQNEVAAGYQDYVLNSIKYHILSSSDDYRIAKNVLRKFAGNDQNVIFFFDGCSANLENADKYTTNTSSQAGGYKIGNVTYNTSAVCIVVRANEQGQAEIVFATRHAATLPDQVRLVKEKYGNTDVGCIKDGIYNITASSMSSVPAALYVTQGSSGVINAVRSNLDDKTLLNSSADGIFIHKTWGANIDWSVNDESATSIGCLIVGNNDEIYNEFIEKVTGHKDATSKGFSTRTSTGSPYNVLKGQTVGAVVVDRSCYVDALSIIYGDDTIGSLTGRQIAEKITETSAVWHEAVSRNEWKNPFTDISKTNYYYNAVRYLYENGITAGTSATTFSPDSTCTRAEVVTFLWRAAGCPEPKSVRNPFKDVKSSDWFFKPVLWAVEQNITQGTSATTFTPERKCSTAEILTFLFRSVGAGTNGYYQEAADWAENRGLLENTGLKVNPETPCPRKAIAMYLYRIEQ